MLRAFSYHKTNCLPLASVEPFIRSFRVRFVKLEKAKKLTLKAPKCLGQPGHYYRFPRCASLSD